MAAIHILFAVSLGLLAISAAIELGFVSSMVAFLHNGAPSGVYEIYTPGATDNTTYTLSGLPLHLLVDQGHTSNAAAGTALVLIVLVGILALSARHLQLLPYRHGHGSVHVLCSTLYYGWLGLQIPALLLTTGALGYVFYVTGSHDSQKIDQTYAALVQDAATDKYPLLSWTPQNWFTAITMQLFFVDSSLHADLVRHLHVMRAWQYNLIPLFLLQFAETVAAFLEYMHWRNVGNVAPVRPPPKDSFYTGPAMV